MQSSGHTLPRRSLPFLSPSSRDWAASDSRLLVRLHSMWGQAVACVHFWAVHSSLFGPFGLSIPKPLLGFFCIVRAAVGKAICWVCEASIFRQTYSFSPPACCAPAGGPPFILPLLLLLAGLLTSSLGPLPAARGLASARPCVSAALAAAAGAASSPRTAQRPAALKAARKEAPAAAGLPEHNCQHNCMGERGTAPLRQVNLAQRHSKSMPPSLQ